MRSGFFLILIALSIGCSAQPPVAQPSGSSQGIAQKVDQFSVDALGNIYILNLNNHLIKLDANGHFLQQFSAIARHGELHTLDVSNPLRLLLWYKDFGSVVLLDRFLKPATELDLRMNGFGQASAVAQSYDNNIWIFDLLDFSLKKINPQGAELMRTADFRQLFDQPPMPVKIYDDHQTLYLADTSKGIYLFDYFGTLQKFIPIEGLADLVVFNHVVYINRFSEWYKISIADGRLEKVPIPASSPAIKQLITPGFYYFIDAEQNLHRLALQPSLQQ